MSLTQAPSTRTRPRGTMRPRWPSTAANGRWRRSRAVRRLMRRASAQAPGGTANGASLMKGTQVASGFLQPSRTVPVSDVDLAPHAGHLRLRTPEGPSPPLRAGERRIAGREATGGTSPPPLGERAEAGLVSEPALLDGVGRVLQLGGGQGPHEPGVGVRALHGGIVPSALTPTRRDCRQTKNRVGARAHSLFGTHKDSAARRAALSITYLGDC